MLSANRKRRTTPDAEATFAEALRRHQEGRIEDAVTLYRRTLAVRPGHPGAHNNLGIALAARGNVREAVTHYERALVLRPGHAGAHNNLGVALADLGRKDEASAHYRRALALKPDYADAHNNLGVALVASGRSRDALPHLEQALVLKPGYAEVHHNLGIALADLGRYEEAVAHYRQALELNPNYAEACNSLGLALMAQGKTEESVALYQRALALKPDLADTHNNLGIALAELGRASEAMPHYERAIELRPAYPEAHFNKAEIKTFRPGDADLAALENLASGSSVPANKMPLIHFALAKALDDLGDYDRAFQHLARANALKRPQVQYDEPAVAGFFRRIAAVFDANLLEQFRDAGDPSRVPVFVLGMPRSGSTLIEQILASHPQVHGAGELPDLARAVSAVLTSSGKSDLYPGRYPECIPSLDSSTLRQIGRTYLSRLPQVGPETIRIVDKLPDNFSAIGLIRLVLPNARIIHTVRNPADTCVSCFSKQFTSGQPFSYDLAELGRYYRGYARLMDHWRAVLPSGAMLEVAYEDVVNDLEGQARRMIEYCGLNWDDRCVVFHNTGRPVRTASASQVRKPLFRTSLERWRRYEAGIAPLLRELGDLAPR